MLAAGFEFAPFALRTFAGLCFAPGNNRTLCSSSQTATENNKQEKYCECEVTSVLLSISEYLRCVSPGRTSLTCFAKCLNTSPSLPACDSLSTRCPISSMLCASESCEPANGRTLSSRSYISAAVLQSAGTDDGTRHICTHQIAVISHRRVLQEAGFR